MNPKAALSWITDSIDLDGIHSIKNVFPKQFEVYLKLPLPYSICPSFPISEYRYEPDTIENLNKRLAIGKTFFEVDQWEVIKGELLEPIGFDAIAQRFDMPYDASFSLARLMRKSTKRLIHLQRHFAYELQFITQLVDCLGRKCNVGIYIEGNHIFEQFDPTMNQAWFKEAKMEALLHYFQILNKDRQVPYPLFPTYVFDQDKNWCLSSGKLLGGHYCLIACSEKVATQINKLNRASISLKPDDRYA
ncbi:MAG: hypothetical protein AAF985_19410 [Bacteroidota bacterium]